MPEINEEKFGEALDEVVSEENNEQPIDESSEDSTEDNFDEPKKNISSIASEQPIRFYKFVAISFLVITVVLLGIIIFMSSKRATITIVSKQEPIEINSPVEVGLNKDIKGFTTSTVITLSKSFSPTGNKQTPGTAKGRVTLHNKTAKDQPLIATTRLLTADGVLFRIKDKVVVPAGGTVDADVYADKEGESGNIGPEKFTIPGLNEDLQDEIYAESDEAMTGGILTIGVISNEDIMKAEEAMVEELKKEGESLLAKTNGENYKGLFEVVQHTVKADKEIGEEVSEFTLEIKGTVVGVFYDFEGIKNWANGMLFRKSVSDAELVEPGMDDPTISLKDYDLNGDTATINVFYIGQAKLNQDSEQLQKMSFFGKNKDEIRRFVLSLDHVNSVDIEFKPAWIRTVPPVADHVQVIIKYTE